MGHLSAMVAVLHHVDKRATQLGLRVPPSCIALPEETAGCRVRRS